ncbi:MAG: putative nucleotidyltransferase with HDIG domain [Bacteroidia bacterium]|jgi:putative nucleotidyltransferase with HDIG domain
MKNFLSDIRNNHEKLQRAVLFIITGLLIVMLLPKEGKFKYEYQKGRPWSHEDLVAPFNFAIEKSTDELDAEIKQIEDEAKTYLKLDELAKKKAQAGFESKFIAVFKADSSKTQSLKKLDRNLSAGQSILNSIYAQGILRKTNELDNLKDGQLVYLVKGNLATQVNLNQFYTVRTAYNQIKKELKNFNGIQDNLVGNILSENLIQNVEFDLETTERGLNEELNSLSSTRGMIPLGLMVISRGDMVDSEKFLVLESLRKEYQSRLGSTGSYSLILLGQLIMVSIVLTMFYMFLVKYRSDLAQNNWRVTFLLMLILGMIVTSSLVQRIPNINLYLVPFCLLPVIVRSFFDSRIALFAHIVGLIIVGFEAPNGFEFMFLQLIAGIIAIFSLLSLQNRSQLFVSMLIVFVTYSASYFSIAIMQEGNIRNIDLSMFAWFAGSVGLTLLAYPLIFLFEKFFGFISEVTLLELNNTNHKLLRQMASEAPGTFQHSLQVASLAETVIYEIGGNALLVRTGALYHDIGKLHAPMYYVENQVTGVNPHDDLSFEESTKIIINHVIKGIELAKKNRLPEPLIDFIRTHHGTSTVQYFYKSYLSNFPEGELDKEHFSYPGPKPFTKEMAVLMMADSVEAASRSLTAYTVDSVGKLVDSIIDRQFNEGQFDSANITLRDITEARSIFKKKLLNIYHVRMEYPT